MIRTHLEAGPRIWLAQWAILAPFYFTQNTWGSHFRPGPITNLAKRLAVPAPAHHARNRRSLAWHLLIESERPQHVEPIAGHIQEIVSIIGRGSSGLVDLSLDACPLQEQGDDRSSDPAATNQRFSCGSVHHQESFLIISFSSLTPFHLPPQRAGKRVWTGDLPSEDVVWGLCQGSVFDVSDELLYPCTLADLLSQSILILDQEESVYAPLCACLQFGALRLDLLREGVHAIFQESNGLKRGEVSDERQASYELGVFGGWRADQDTQPVNQFSTSCLGGGVNGAFGMASFSPSFHWHDQREPVQRFDDSIEGTIVELHGRGKTALAYHRRQFVGIQRALGEQR